MQLVLDLTLPDARRRIAGAGNVVHTGIVWQESLIVVPLIAGIILEPAGEAALVFPMNGHPAEMHGLKLRQRRTAGVGLAHRTNPPGTVLESEGRRTIHLEFLAIIADPAGPEAKLIQARRVHDDVTFVAQRLPSLLNTGGARREHQVTLDSGFVFLYDQAMASHRLLRRPP